MVKRMYVRIVDVISVYLINFILSSISFYRQEIVCTRISWSVFYHYQRGAIVTDVRPFSFSKTRVNSNWIDKSLSHKKLCEYLSNSERMKKYLFDKAKIANEI
jgi:hypothetical protein